MVQHKFLRFTPLASHPFRLFTAISLTRLDKTGKEGPGTIVLIRKTCVQPKFPNLARCKVENLSLHEDSWRRSSSVLFGMESSTLEYILWIFRLVKHSGQEAKAKLNEN